MAYEAQQPLKITLPASAALAQASYNEAFVPDSGACQYTFVEINSSGEADLLSSATAAVIGVLQNQPYVRSQAGSQAGGVACEITIIGVTKLVSSGTINPGAYVAPTSTGQAVSAALVGYGSGYVEGTKKAVGLMTPIGGTAAASGDVSTAVVNCLNPLPAV
jgi:hypothetical protein